MACFLCGAPDAVIICEGDDEAACAERLASWRPTGLLAALGEAEDGPAAFTHIHNPSYLEPDYDEDGAPYPNPHGFGTVAEFVPFTPYAITFRPYVTPLDEIPAALGGTKRA